MDFKVLLSVPGDNLTTVLEVIKGNASIISINANDEPKTKKKMRYANGKRDKGITGEELALQILTRNKDMKFTLMSTIRSEFVNKGFAPTSASAAISTLVSKGRARRIGDDQYTLGGTQ
jgi:hypothetical protein